VGSVIKRIMDGWQVSTGVLLVVCGDIEVDVEGSLAPVAVGGSTNKEIRQVEGVVSTTGPLERECTLLFKHVLLCGWLGKFLLRPFALSNSSLLHHPP